MKSVLVIFFFDDSFCIKNLKELFKELSGGIGTSAEVPAITGSSPGHSGFNIPFVGALDPLREDSWECGCPDTRVTKKKK